MAMYGSVFSDFLSASQKNHMTTHVITRWGIHIMSLTTSMSTTHLLKRCLFCRDNIPF